LFSRQTIRHGFACGTPLSTRARPSGRLPPS
jgi:hypothetical protein